MVRTFQADSVKREYFALRRVGWLAKWAYHGAVTRCRWRALGGWIVADSEARECCKLKPWDGCEGRVRIRVVPDDTASFDDLCGDTYNPTAHPDIPPARIAREREEFRRMVDSGGVWGIIGEFWNGDRWQQVDSCYGFVGDDWRESGYLEDCQWATLEALASCLDNEARDVESLRPDMYGDDE